jgi:malate dehydrogenase (oxaloacetate-decarboxylating)
VTNTDPIEFHRAHRGKIGTLVKTPISSRTDLSLAYTPGVGAVPKRIHDQPSEVWELTNRQNTIAIVTDGTAVLGLGDIGPEAGLAVMEGKAVLFKEFGNIDAVPICLATKDVNEIVNIVTALAPSFGGVNLEDISAPRCFEIESQLKQRLNIPVMHDDQHGTAVVVLAALINALKIVGKTISAKIVISGAGAAGIAIAKILLAQGAENLILVNSKGIISKTSPDLNEPQSAIAQLTNSNNQIGSLAEALVNADVFIGVSAPNIVDAEMIKHMNKDAIVMALANPIPEIMPDIAKAAGARIVATGRSDFANQVNNVLAFPGIFRGALDAHASQITEKMKLAAATALAEYVTNPDEEHIIPDVLDKNVTNAVAQAVKLAVA